MVRDSNRHGKMPPNILIEAQQDEKGNITVRPVADRWARKFALAVEANGGPSLKEQLKDNLSIFFQQEDEAVEGDGTRSAAVVFFEELTRRQQCVFVQTGSVRYLMDAWAVGYWYGWECAETCLGKGAT